MLSHMSADNKAILGDSQADLSGAFEARIVDIFVWLLTDDKVETIDRLTDSVHLLR